MTGVGMWGSSRLRGASGGHRAFLLRCAVLGLLVAAYGISFTRLHGVVGNPAFLLGFIPCLAAAVLLGLRGALVMVLVVQLIDRSFALSTLGTETNMTAGVIALLSKLLVAGGLGMALDTRRRVAALNAQLSSELHAR